MYYATIGGLAILILLIENYDLLFRRIQDVQPVWKDYRHFLIAVLAYEVTDVLWGILESRKLAFLLYADTTLYFIAMAFGVLFWTKFVVTYPGEQHTYGKFLLITGRVLAAVEISAVLLNLAVPVLFSVDAQCVYRANPFRYVLLISQIILLVLTALRACQAVVQGKVDIRNRHIAIAGFGFIMAAFLTIQLWHPYLPLYSVAYLLGTCLLHTFVINNEKEAYKTKLELAIVRENQQYEELVHARRLAYKDALTGVRTKLAYLEYEAKWDAAIQKGLNVGFAIAVFDVNGLKIINDTLGHEKGDQFIIEACRMICRHFQHSPVFRIGGDEFVAILDGEDYQNRDELKRSFDQMMELSKQTEQIVIAMGLSVYDAKEDGAFHDVFTRADRLMYQRKHFLKSLS